MRRLMARIEKAARASAAVLVVGESGTGKELVARALHDLGPRASRPFVTVDCGALAPALVASELFGHERGAFTGADRRHPGAFERADGGTVFLDEIGELPQTLQPALLGALERKLLEARFIERRPLVRRVELWLAVAGAAVLAAGLTAVVLYEPRVVTELVYRSPER